MKKSFALEELDPRALTANPANFRRHPEGQRRALRASLEEHGAVAGPIWNRKTGHLIDGHARVELALEDGEDRILVNVVEMPLAQEKRLLRSFDQIGGMAEIDNEALDALIAEIDDASLEQLLGEVADPVSGLLPEADPDALPEVVETRCQMGDLWRLGEHRLLCGDCTEAANVQRLMLGGASAHVLLTDPPYGVGYIEKARDMNRRGYGHSRAKSGAAIEGDDGALGGDVHLWRAALESAAGGLRADAAVYLWHATHSLRALYNLLAELGFLHHDTLVWLKPNFVIGRCDYQSNYESCFYGWKQGHRPPFYGPKNQTTVWSVGRDTTHPDHPTQKPVGLFTPPILNHTRPTEAVYDAFAGSGTTVIACEQTGRAARCIEIEPRYCDLILARWEAATGREAEHRE
jgi:DNA modification methylase